MYPVNSKTTLWIGFMSVRYMNCTIGLCKLVLLCWSAWKDAFCANQKSSYICCSYERDSFLVYLSCRWPLSQPKREGLWRSCRGLVRSHQAYYTLCRLFWLQGYFATEKRIQRRAVWVLEQRFHQLNTTIQNALYRTTDCRRQRGGRCNRSSLDLFWRSAGHPKALSWFCMYWYKVAREWFQGIKGAGQNWISGK